MFMEVIDTIVSKLVYNHNLVIEGWFFSIDPKYQQDIPVYNWLVFHPL